MWRPSARGALPGRADPGVKWIGGLGEFVRHRLGLTVTYYSVTILTTHLCNGIEDDPLAVDLHGTNVRATVGTGEHQRRGR